MVPFLYSLAAYSVMVGEFLLAVMIWFRPLRYPILALGFALHFGINLTMQFPIFQYMMMVSLINFIYPEDIEKLLSRIRVWRGLRSV